MKTFILLFAFTFAASAQSITIGAPVFTGSGLNDATSGGRWTSAPANALYEVTICAAGTPDTRKVRKNGGAYGACVNLTGGAQALGDGVTVAFGATTGHTPGALWAISVTASGSMSTSTVVQRGVGAIFRDAQEKERESPSAIDFGADPMNTRDSTDAIQRCIKAAGSRGCRLPGMQTGSGVVAAIYMVSCSSCVTSLDVGNGQRLYGDGPNLSVILQATNNSDTVGLSGYKWQLDTLFVGRETGVTGGHGIVAYPDVTSTSQPSDGVSRDVSVAAAWCNNDPSNACQSAANINRMDACLLIQSGVKDVIFNTFVNFTCSWAVKGVHIISGGLTGSSGAGATNSQIFLAPHIDNTTTSFELDASAGNRIIGGTCTNASHAIFTLGVAAGGIYTTQPSDNNQLECFGEANAAHVDTGSATPMAGNSYWAPTNQVFGPNITILGANAPTLSVPIAGNLLVGYYTTGDAFVCAPFCDTLNNSSTATIQFNERPNTPQIFRFTNKAAFTDITQDWLNWNPYTRGYSFRGGSAYTGPIHKLNSNAGPLAGATGMLSGGANFGAVGAAYLDSCCVSTTKVTIAAQTTGGNPGTIAVTNGSAAVVGTGTSFSGDYAGRLFVIAGQYYRIGTYTDATHVTLTSAFTGVTASGIAYETLRLALDVLGDGAIQPYASAPLCDAIHARAVWAVDDVPGVSPTAWKACGKDSAGTPTTVTIASASGGATFTPALAFGGSSTGITYAIQSGSYVHAGPAVIATIHIALTSKGSATGAATVSGLPAGIGTSSAGSFGFMTGFSGLTSPTVYAPGGGSILNLYQFTSGGVGSLQDTNFTNTSEFILTVTYY